MKTLKQLTQDEDNFLYNLHQVVFDVKKCFSKENFREFEAGVKSFKRRGYDTSRYDHPLKIYKELMKIK